MAERGASEGMPLLEAIDLIGVCVSTARAVRARRHARLQHCRRLA